MSNEFLSHWYSNQGIPILTFPTTAIGLNFEICDVPIVAFILFSQPT